jgi:Neuraminidase (sialidase)
MKRVLMGLLVTVAYTSLAFGDWSGLADDQIISLFPNPVNYISSYDEVIAASPNGDLYAVWAIGGTGTPYEVAFSKSTDNGRTWSGTSADRIINAEDGEGIINPTLQQNLSMAVGGSGNFYVVWAESLTNVSCEIMFIKSTDGGSTWVHSDTDFPISFPGGNRALQPVIAVDIDENLHVIWQQNTGANAEIHYGFSSDYGDIWTSQSGDRVISFANGNPSFNPDMTTDNDGNIYVIWKENSSPSPFGVVKFGKKLATEPQFSCETEDIPVCLPDTNTGTCSIVVTPNSSIHVVWEARHRIGTSYRGVIYYSRSTDGGATWSGLTGRQNVDQDAFDDTTSSYPEMVATSQGDLAVVYSHEGSYTSPRVSLSRDDGVTWSGNTMAEVISHYGGDDTRSAYNSDICVSVGDTLHVVWHEDCLDLGGGSGYYEVMYSRGDTLGTSGQPGCEYVPGDINNNGFANGVDVSYGVNYFKGFGPPPPLTCPDCPEPGEELYAAGDVNGNCIFNGVDITYFVTFLRGGGQELMFCPSCPPAR